MAIVPGRGTMTWSDAGNMKTDGKGTTFTHDGRNRLTKAVKADGTTMAYVYGADGLRIESIKNPTGTSPSGMPIGGTATRHLLSGSEEIGDLDAGGNVIRRFVPGAGIDERVAQVDANGVVTYIHNDKQNSVIAISDTAGNPVVRRGYGTYGETDPTQMTGTTSAGSTAHPFGYTGRRWDNDLGLYYYRARWYDPELGTFLQTDPIGSLDYVNLYSYVGAEPGNATDPSGMIKPPEDQKSCPEPTCSNSTKMGLKDSIKSVMGIASNAPRSAGIALRDELRIAGIEIQNEITTGLLDEVARINAPLPTMLNPASQILQGGTQVQGFLPNVAPSANSVLYKSNDAGAVTNYAVYGADARMILRVDITGRDHGKVPTPHVVTYSRNWDARTGMYYVAPNRSIFSGGARGAAPWEIP